MKFFPFLILVLGILWIKPISTFADQESLRDFERLIPLTKSADPYSEMTTRWYELKSEQDYLLETKDRSFRFTANAEGKMRVSFVTQDELRKIVRAGLLNNIYIEMMEIPIPIPAYQSLLQNLEDFISVDYPVDPERITHQFGPDYQISLLSTSEISIKVGSSTANEKNIYNSMVNQFMSGLLVGSAFNLFYLLKANSNFPNSPASGLAIFAGWFLTFKLGPKLTKSLIADRNFKSVRPYLAFGVTTALTTGPMICVGVLRKLSLL